MGDLAAEEVIDANTPCVSCGYNLRGLSVEGTCPECGASVACSIRGDLLRFSHPRWVGRLGTGAALLFYANLLAIAAVIVDAVISGVVQLQQSSLAWVYDAVFAVLGLTLISMLFAGVWVLASPDPRESPRTRGRWVRLACREGIVALVVGVPLLCVPLSVFPDLRLVLSVGFLVAFLGWNAAVFLHIGRLADRVPSRSVVRLSRICLWLLLADAALYAVKLVLELLGPQIGPSATSSQPGTQGSAEDLTLSHILGCYEGLLFLISIGFGILTLVLCWRCRRTFREAADEARRNWADAEVSLGHR